MFPCYCLYIYIYIYFFFFFYRWVGGFSAFFWCVLGAWSLGFLGGSQSRVQVEGCRWEAQITLPKGSKVVLFGGLPYRILSMNHKKDLLRSLWVYMTDLRRSVVSLRHRA